MGNILYLHYFAGTFSLTYKYHSQPVNKQFTVPFSLHRMLHTAFPSLPATVPVFWNVSMHFFYPSAHSVIASTTRCWLNLWKLSNYRKMVPPSWGNSTWQVPSQLPHSESESMLNICEWANNMKRYSDVVWTGYLYPGCLLINVFSMGCTANTTTSTQQSFVAT